MLRFLLLALATSLALAACGAAAHRPQRAAPARCCATPSRSPRPASTRRRSPTCTRARCWPTSSRRRSTTSTWREPARMRANTAAALPEVVGRLQALRLSHPARASTSPTTRPSRAQRRELTAADYVYSIKRHYDPRWKSGKLYQLESAEAARPVGAAQRGHRAEEALRLRPRGRGPARARPLQLRGAAGASRAPRLHSVFTDPGLTGAVAREVVEFYGDKDRRAPGGHRALPAGAVAAQLAHRAGAQPELPRGASTTSTRPPATRARAGLASGAQGPARLPMVDRVEIAIIEEQQPRWLSFLNERARRVERVPDEFAHRRCPNNQLAPNLAKRGIRLQRYRRADVAMSYFAHGEPGGRRLHARQGGAAPRDLAGVRPRSRDPPGAARPGDPAQSHRRAADLGLRPGVQVRDERIRPRQGPGAARPARLRRPRRRRLARAARRPAAAARVRHAARRQLARSSTSSGRST